MRFIRKRFSLLEIIVSLGILMTLIALAGEIVFSVQKNWLDRREQTAELESRIRLEMIADRVFRNAVPFTWRDDNLKNRQLFLGESGRLIAAASCRINNASQSGIRFFEIYRDGDRLVAAWREQPIVYWEAEDLPDAVTRETLASGVARLEFRYAARDNGDIVWREDWERDDERIPAAIMMTVEFSDGETLSFLRRTAGNGRFTNWGKWHDADK